MKWFLGLVLIAMAATAMLASYGSHSYYRTLLATDTTVVIAPGTGARQVLEQLHAAGAMPEPWKIAIPVYLSKQYRNLKAGEYALKAGMTPDQIMTMLIRGDVVVHKVTIPEGFTVAQIVAALMAEPLLTGGLPTPMLEGDFFPNTYYFQRGEDRTVVLNRMQAAMARTVTEHWEKRTENLPLKTSREAVILASIIEAETPVAAERPIVASVYINRLRKGMKLQADPTVAYGIDPTNMKNHTLSIKDLGRDHPYNTYTRFGLPPGPIGNPGEASIAAALNPATTDYLYFVATGDGGHRFATTLAEHNRNVAEYRKVQREQRRDQ